MDRSFGLKTASITPPALLTLPASFRRGAFVILSESQTAQDIRIAK